MGCGTSNSGDERTKVQRNIQTLNQARQNPSAGNINPDPPSNAERQRELDNNPNFFYNEDLFLQQAVRQSLLENNPNQRQQTEEEVFNDIIKETIVASKKEYDDIDRKKNEEEIEKIKNDPTALNNKIKNIFAANNAFKNAKKLPPLEFSGNSMGSKLEKKDLKLVKAPILKDSSGQLESTGRKDARDSLFANQPADTNSEIDINEDDHFKGEVSKPSYNPSLLKDEKNKNNNLQSLESNEFKPSELNQYADGGFNKSKGKNNELNALINELKDDEPVKYVRKIDASKHHNETTMDHPKPHEKLVSNDSFEDLMDEFDPIENNDKPPGMAKVEFISKPTDEDGFGF
ncbi:unnamed protein product [Moneuplotes crassus]|uniref:Uncharacterized protein n=1 Tax=Euplotes crassus TaxID=5936 RepID=A0AAD1X3E4_EUPCR|nr:unnamed protein product [Moneuplotes crassus]